MYIVISQFAKSNADLGGCYPLKLYGPWFVKLNLDRNAIFCNEAFYRGNGVDISG